MGAFSIHSGPGARLQELSGRGSQSGGWSTLALPLATKEIKGEALEGTRREEWGPEREERHSYRKEGRGSGWEFLHLLTGLCRPIPGQQSKSIPRPPMAPTCFPRCWHFQKPAANDPGLGDPQNMGDGSWGRGQDGARRAL